MKPIDRIAIVVCALITFLMASAGVTSVYYWALGGSFKLEVGNVGLFVYALLELYLALVIINVTKGRSGRIQARRNQ